MTINNEEWVAALVESSDDAIIGKGLDATIRSWNSGATRMFGYTEEEVLGRSIVILIPLPLRAQEVDILLRLQRGERVDHYETTRLRKDGTKIHVSVSVSPILSSAGEMIGAAKIVRALGATERPPTPTL